MKIVFVIGSLRGGGAERVLSLVVNELSTRGHEITVITKTPECDYILNTAVKWRPIFEREEIKSDFFDKLSRRVKYFPRLLLRINKEKPDLTVSFLVGMNSKVTIISKLLNIPVIVSEHTNYKAGVSFSSWVERRWIYKLANAVTVLTKYDYDNYYSKFLNNVYVMPNPVSFESINELRPRDKTILASGVLDRWSIKGFDNLLKIFSNVVIRHPDWKLKIAGAGDKGREYLESLAISLNIENNIEFLGFCTDLDSTMRESSIFVLSSRYEGFGMVLIEAMSQGCACISYDCVAGPGEIITNGMDGILVKDQNTEVMEAELCRLIDDDELRWTLANNARENVKKFSLNAIGNRWEQLARTVTS
ncbi:glycosyltransferase family 4 protein [uncultured Psychrobacter sp.]|uniref:glycosyltransferase family 4 protein n=1 Tax=uncultured Psychrobacter sp. TaxID=259303 RepID=UPI0026188AEE|nr:glycosyltransferase family 4 protein [uncultured Psychrobacter sp.]